MQYIVLDLEWNQPVSYNTAVYRRVGDKLMFEVIQIGAVKLNEDFSVADSLSIPVRPTHYVTIHPRVRRMTGLDAETLSAAPAFLEAMEQFMAWCGEDCAWLTWGCDDISVLQQNIDFFGYDKTVPGMYDIQRFYAKRMELGASQKALKSAMEQLEIEPDESKAFHNAVYDAYYTALVLAKLDQPEGVLEYQETPRKIGLGRRRTRMRVTHMVKSVQEALASATVITPACPGCEKPCKLTSELVYQAPGKFVALAKCAQHGAMFVRVRFAKMPDGQVGMALSVSSADRQTKAYVHTKELQFQLKRKRGDYDGVDLTALPADGGSNMPFEEY